MGGIIRARALKDLGSRGRIRVKIARNERRAFQRPRRLRPLKMSGPALSGMRAKNNRDWSRGHDDEVLLLQRRGEGAEEEEEEEHRLASDGVKL